MTQNARTVRVVLLCHGETDAVRNAAFAADEPLTSRGLAEVAEVAESLPSVGSVRCAESTCCTQTAKALGVEPILDPELAGCDYGDWRGLTLEQVQTSEPSALAMWLTDPTVAPHGGESIRSLVQRVGRWLDGLPEQRQALLAITDASVIRAAIVHAMQAGPESIWRVDVAPLGRTVLSGRSGRWTLRSTG
jgi:broad specificity phosphatase PhoE